MKICARCGMPQPRDAFYADHSRPDGLQRTCKRCDRRRLDQADDTRRAQRQHAAAAGEPAPVPAPPRPRRGRPNPNPDFGTKYRGKQPRKLPRLSPTATRREVLEYYITAHEDALAEALVLGALGQAPRKVDTQLLKTLVAYAFGPPPERNADESVLAGALQILHDRRNARLAAGHAGDAAPEPEPNGA